MPAPLRSVLSAITFVVLIALAAPRPPASAQPRNEAPRAAVAASPRPLTHLATDKPLYRPGERLYLRGALLDAVHHKPIGGSPSVLVEIKGPKGDTVHTSRTVVRESTLGVAWDVPAGQAGGAYTVRVSYPHSGYPPAERDFAVRAYRAPRLKSEIVFLREGYGPGDAVAATMHVDRAEGGVPAGADVTAVARVDGREIHRGTTRLDERGDCRVEFALPDRIIAGTGSLSLIIEDGGVVETAAKTIPILLARVDVAVYPEGGDLVAGVPNRVYFEARRPNGKPADIAGVVVNGAGVEVGAFSTEHEGRGRFRFRPQAGKRYRLRITEPAGIAEPVELPEIRPDGVVLASLRDVTGPGAGVGLSLLSPTRGRVRVTLAKRDLEVASATVTLAAGRPARLRLRPEPDVDGVLVATVWDEDGRPLAERLVYRQPASAVRIEIESDRSSYVPGDDVELVVRTLDGEGRPVGATVGLIVTDDSVLEMIEAREQAPRLPVMVLLENDVREMADAHVYLDADNAGAPRALDLLLGTQGWRRFAFVDVDAFIAAHGDAARRVTARLEPVPARREWRDVVFEGAFPDAAPPPAIFDAKPALIARRGNRPAQADGFLLKREPFAEEELIAGADRAWAPPRPHVIVREYAHIVRPDRRPGERIDFTETLYFNAGLTTDPSTGSATVRFGLSDAVTSFRVLADAFTEGGALGAASTLIESVEPFYVEPKMPLEVTEGDVVNLPIAVVNATGDRLEETVITLSIPGGGGTVPLERLALDPHARGRLLHEIRTSGLSGAQDVVIAAQAGPYADTVTRPLSVKPRGFPRELAWGGVLDAGGAVEHVVVIPESLAPGSLVTAATLYPAPLANLTEALERLIREPHGCFEQTSSTTYPLVMAQQYFLSHQGIDPSLIERSRGLLAKGYERLIGFRTSDHGYEWFGQDPGHEALSAYGLLEFSDMSEVREVDSAMLAALRGYLLERRDGAGGFTRARRALHTWIADPDCSNGYILFALLNGATADEVRELEIEIAHFEDAATGSDNAYVTALAANVMALAGREDSARSFRQRLAKAQTAEGWVDGATTSIVGSGGEALRIETTALAVLAWLRDDAFAGPVESAMRWLAGTCESGRFGSTQSTVLALRAIVEYDRSRARPKAPGAVIVSVDGEPVGRPVRFDRDAQGAIELPDLAGRLGPGRHTVGIRMRDGSAMPYSLSVGYHAEMPPSDGACALDLDVALRDTAIAEGVATEAAVTVVNRRDEAVASPVAIVGIPGGLEVRHDQLRELADAGAIASYEVLGRDVVLYWRSLKPGQRVDLDLSLVGAVPGRYTGPASRAYLYYTDEHKTWDEGLAVTIAAR